MRKIIKIFLASSIVEFVSERREIENFIRNVSDKFEEHYDVKLQPILCENLDDAYAGVRKQEEYNELIRGCELCFFLFFTKAGEYTREEFEVAAAQFAQTGKPKIYTYFKVVQDGEAEQALRDFMSDLDHVFGHYYSTFTHLDTVKLRILLSLKLREMDFLEVKAEGGRCLVDGRAVLSLDNVSEFANNAHLGELQAELREVESEYFSLRAEYDQKSSDAAFCSRYSKVASHRQNLIDEIEELQGLIFNVSLRMIKDDLHGEITPRQKAAYRLFEQGDYDGCMRVLDADEIDNDFLRQRRQLQEQEKALCKKYIREHKTAIDILGSMTQYANRFDEIEARYAKIIPLILEMRIELDTAYAYVVYLTDQNKNKESLALAEKLLPLYESEEDRAYVLNALANNYHDLNQPQEAESCYLSAIKIHKQLAAENPERFKPDLAMSYNNAGVFYKNQGQPSKAEHFYRLAIEICEQLAKDNPERFKPDLAASYNNAGNFYSQRKQPAKAEQFYLLAIEIYEQLAKENPKRFNSDLATSYNNAGNFYSQQKQPAKAEHFYLLAIEIYEQLAKENPERFNPDLAVSYFNYAIFSENNTFFEKALQLAKTQPDHPMCRKIIKALTE